VIVPGATHFFEESGVYPSRSVTRPEATFFEIFPAHCAYGLTPVKAQAAERS